MHAGPGVAKECQMDERREFVSESCVEGAEVGFWSDPVVIKVLGFALAAATMIILVFCR